MLKIIYKIIGGIFLLAGLIMFPLPLPFGLIFIVLGSFILIGSSSHFAGLLRKCRGKYPNFNRIFSRMANKMPKTIRRQLAKTDPHQPL